MQKEDILKYIDNPEELNEYSLSELRAMIKKYPYFQMAYALFIVNLKNIKDPRFEEFLKKYSVFTKNRNQLFRYINYIERLTNEKSGEPVKTDSQKPEEGINESKTVNEKHSKTELKPETEEKKQDKGEEYREGGVRKRTEERKKKQYTRKYLGDRISKTLSNQIDEADKKDELDEEVNTEFFILDKTSKVKKEPDKGEAQGSQDSSDSDHTVNREIGEAFELEEKTGEKADKKNKGKHTHEFGKSLSGQYFYGNYLAYKQENEKEDLVDQFIKNDPEPAIKAPEESGQKDISRESVEEHDDYLSEKLADLFIKQGYYNKAIQAFEKLSLKYPEKSDYFAERIEKVKQIINEQ